MNSLDNLDNLLAFSSLEDSIKKRNVLSKYERIRIDQVEDSFQDIVEGIKSLTNAKSSYVLVPNLKEILESTGHYFDKKKSKQKIQIEEAVKEFEVYIKTLEILKENPVKFYFEELSKRKRLEYTCERLKEFYQRKLDEEYNNKPKEEFAFRFA
jgi:hypothetical protein